MNVIPPVSAWTYLSLRGVPSDSWVFPLVVEEDPGGPAHPVLCALHDRPVLEPYLKQLRLWESDPITHPQPVIPVTRDDSGIAWFSPEGAREDFPDRVS